MNTNEPSNASPLPTVYLVAVDGSPSAVMVLDMACGLGAALAGAAELHIVHVVSAPSSGVELMTPLGVIPPDLEASGKLVLERAAEHAASRFKGKIVGHLASGVAWREIVQLAANLSADLVLVGTAGRTGIARMLLGSTAEQAVRHAGSPVLVLRPKDHHASTEVGIEPPCGDCVTVQVETQRAKLWCERHSTPHPHAHLHYQLAPTFGIGSMNFSP